MRRRHPRSLTVTALGVALVVVGCAAPDGSPASDPAAVIVPAEATTPTSLSPAVPDPVPSEGTARSTAPAPEVWHSRDLSPTVPPAVPTPAAEPVAPAPASAPPVSPTLPAPTPQPDPTPPPAPAPPELVIGDDGCVTDLTTGLVVTCYDPAAGPDDAPAPE